MAPNNPRLPIRKEPAMKPAFAIAGSLLATSLLAASGQTAFQNLDFEAANVPPLPPDQYAFVSPTLAFPGWTCYYGDNVATQVVQNTVSLGIYNISILGPNLSIPGVNIRILDGSYSAVLQSGFNPPGPILPATIAQTATVPSTALSLQMKVRAFSPSDLSGLLVTLGGQTVPMHPLQTTTNYVLLGGDITSFAGLREQLRITSLPLPSYSNNSLELDSITFSPQAVPEPHGCALILLGAATVLYGKSRFFRRS
jgi:hypothetical protein